MIPQGKFNKRTFKGYAKQACDRRLYLHLGNGREGWTYSDGKPVALDEQTHGQAQTVVVYGKIFEEQYLHALCSHEPDHILDCTPAYIDEDVWPSVEQRQQKEIEDWARIQEAVAQNGFVFAFELMWKPEVDFITHMLGADFVQQVESSRGDRPDVLLFEKHSGTDVFFTLDANNQVYLEERAHHGLVVTILDIKNTPLEKSERHFSDVIYYILSLLYRLRALGLSDTIAVRGIGNGILGRMDFAQLQEVTPSLLREMIHGREVLDSSHVPFKGHIGVDWELYKSQCVSFQRGLSMVMKKKNAFEEVSPTISKDCQYCVFAHHCLNGALDTTRKELQKPSGNDDISVLPSMKPQLLQSLNRVGIHTVRDLVQKAQDLYQKNMNQTVCDEYAPALRELYFQALSIKSGVVLDQHAQTYQSIFAPGAFTTHLPPQKNNFLFLDVEGDPAQKRLVSLSFTYNQHTHVFVNRSIEIQSESALIQEFSQAVQKEVGSLFDIPIVFWGAIQRTNLSEALDRHPDLEQDCSELFRIFASGCSFSSPKLQNQIYDLERAVDTLFAFPMRFAVSWHEAHDLLCAQNTGIELDCWGKGKNFFDFSIWNLYAGEPKNIQYTSSFSHSNPQEVITPTLERLFHQRGIVHSEDCGWVGNDGIRVLIEQELHKKMNALVRIMKEIYRRSATFIYASPLHVTNKKEFDIPELDPRSSAITRLLWDYEMMDRWTGFSAHRSMWAHPHETVMKQKGVWVFPAKAGKKEFHVPKLLQNSIAGLDFYRDWMKVFSNSRYDLRSLSSLQVQKTKTGLIPFHRKHRSTTGLVFEGYKDIWVRRFTHLVQTLLDQSALSHNFPLTPEEPWGKQPFTSSPGSAELYFCAAAELRRQGELSIEPSLKTKIKPAPSDDQKQAILSFLRYPIALIQGPPGTGKSSTIIAMLDEWLLRRQSNQTSRILVTAANYAAMTVVAQKVQKEEQLDIPIRLISFEKRENNEKLKESCVFLEHSSKHGWQTKRWRDGTFVRTQEEAFPENCIVFANEYSLGKHHKDDVHIPSFDLIVVDEASQLSPDHFLAALAFVHPLKTKTRGSSFTVTTPKNDWTKVLVVGDGDQLSAVRKVEIPKRYQMLLRSIYSFYEYQLEREEQNTVQLFQNFRSVSPIIQSINALGIYNTDLLSYDGITSCPLWIHRTRLFSEEHPFSVGVLVHRSRTDVHRSPTEIQLTVHAVLRLWKSSPESIIDFFTEHVGVVTPHNAQRIALGDELEQELEPYFSADEQQRIKEKQVLRGAIRTVDKFQGSDRSIIISCVGVSSPVRLKEEEDFLYQLNRFNVTISRPKYRLLFICSQTFLFHIPKQESSVKMIKGLNAIIKKICTQQKTVSEGGYDCILHYSAK